MIDMKNRIYLKRNIPKIIQSLQFDNEEYKLCDEYKKDQFADEQCSRIEAEILALQRIYKKL